MIMLQKTCLSIALLCFAIPLFCQDNQPSTSEAPRKTIKFKHPYLPGPNELPESYYLPNSDTTIYFAVHTLFSSLDPISYLSPVLSYDRKLDDQQYLQTGEGNKAVLESNIFVPWTILRGRNQSNDFYQSSRVTFNYWGQIRVAKDGSSPILPPTNSVGLSWDYAPIDSFRGGLFFGKKKYNGRYDSRNFWKNQKDSTYHALTTQLKIMHYSNGQPTGFYVDSMMLRHDYLNGDFSTNFFQGLVGYHIAWPKGDILSLYGGYRLDVQLSKNFLQFVPEQEQNYGQHRALMNIQYVLKPFEAWSIKKKIRMEESINGEVIKYRLKEFIGLQLRTEIVYIAGNLDKWRFKAPDRNREYRWSIKNSLKINILRNRNFGLVFQHYYGRDYLNIRFDNVINIFLFGFNFKFNKNPILSFPNSKYAVDKK